MYKPERRRPWIVSAFALSVLALGFILLLKSKVPVEKNRLKNFVISWVGSPISWDPLDFDNANNLFAARMLYATPVEASRDGALTSRVLESFSVAPDQLKISLIVQDNLKYADGTPLTAHDVAFAIARMAYVRPQFPVLESIQGLMDWRTASNSLASFPTGIKVNGDEVSIHLTRAEPNALYRFTLEIFGIIPRRCIDTETNKLNCDRPPESGPYILASGGLKAKELEFARREGEASSAPERIRFQFIEPSETEHVLSKEDGNTVVFGSDLNYTDEDLSKLKERFAYLPTAKSWHGRFLINSRNPLLKSRECRQVLAQAIRNAFGDLKLQNHRLETSIFTELMPGYSPPDQLNYADPPTAPEIEICKAKLRGQTLLWMRRGTRMDDFARALSYAAEKLEMKVSEVPAGSMTVPEAMNSSDVALVAGGTGFWPVDPFGDLQMLFTPNMHKHLAAVANNPQLQAAIRATRQSSSPPPDQLNLINQILFDEAIYNVFTHHQYMYLGSRSSESTLRRSPLGVTVPYPWQVFDESAGR